MVRMIPAVVLDIGGVLEVIDDAVFPAPFESGTGSRRVPWSRRSADAPATPVSAS